MLKTNQSQSDHNQKVFTLLTVSVTGVLVYIHIMLCTKNVCLTEHSFISTATRYSSHLLTYSKRHSSGFSMFYSYLIASLEDLNLYSSESEHIQISSIQSMQSPSTSSVSTVQATHIAHLKKCKLIILMSQNTMKKVKPHSDQTGPHCWSLSRFP